MKKNRLAKNSLAVGLATLIVTAGLSFSANGADTVIAQSEASAVTASGLTGIVDTNECRAESTGPATQGTGTCGTGLATQKVGVTTQNAATGLDGNKGTSAADASVASVGLNALTEIDLSTVPDDLDAIDTGTVLDDILEGLDPLTKPLFEAALKPLLTSIQTAALSPVLEALQNAIPVSVNIGAVTSACTLTAGGDPVLSSSVAGINIVADLGGGNTITVPVALNTDANAALIGSIAPKQLVDGLLKGIEDSLNLSLNKVLGPLADLVSTVQKTLVDNILEQLGTSLLDPVGEALSPILKGTVNKQVTNADGSAEVTALDLSVLGDTAKLALARTSCGPNSVLTTDDPADGPAGDPADGPAGDPADGPAGDPADGPAGDPADGPAGDPADGPAGDPADADANSDADADVTRTLPDTGAPNLLPLWIMGAAFVLFGGAILLNEKRRKLLS